jgi:hypothetical protein
MLKKILIAAALVGFPACTLRCDDEGREKSASVEFETEEKQVEIPVPDIDVEGEDEAELPEE